MLHGFPSYQLPINSTQKQNLHTKVSFGYEVDMPRNSNLSFRHVFLCQPSRIHYSVSPVDQRTIHIA